MERVEKYISDSMNWLNSKMNAQNKLSLTQDPVVKVSEIVTKSKVRNSIPFSTVLNGMCERTTVSVWAPSRLC